MDRITTAQQVDTIALILRICSYALQFLPSPGYTLDKIRGVPLTKIRDSCDSIAQNLEMVAVAADTRGSFIRVQYLILHGLQCRMECNTSSFFQMIARATHVAQDVATTEDSSALPANTSPVDHDIETRVFYNLYILNNLVSRQMGHGIPLWPYLTNYHAYNWQRSRSTFGDALDSASLSPESYDPFIERVLQARLAKFWRNIRPSNRTAGFDLVVAEEQYDQFCREYVAQLPPRFSLVDPDESCDARYPKVALQRMLLHISIHESISCHFRPLLFEPPATQPAYKVALMASQRRTLAVAAIRSLECVNKLHSLLGNSHTRLPIVIFSTLEAAVLLMALQVEILHSPLALAADKDTANRRHSLNMDNQNLQASTPQVTRQCCFNMAKRALKRLQMLSEVSSMAEVGANTLLQLMEKTSSTEPTSSTETMSSMEVDGRIGGLMSLEPLHSQQLQHQQPTFAEARSTGTNVYSWMADETGDVMSLENSMHLGGHESGVGDITTLTASASNTEFTPFYLN